MSSSRPPVSSVEVMGELGGQAAKGLSMGGGRISWVPSSKEHSKGKNSPRIYSHLSHLWEPEENILLWLGAALCIALLIWDLGPGLHL